MTDGDTAAAAAAAATVSLTQPNISDPVPY